MELSMNMLRHQFTPTRNRKGSETSGSQDSSDTNSLDSYTEERQGDTARKVHTNPGSELSMAKETRNRKRQHPNTWLRRMWRRKRFIKT